MKHLRRHWLGSSTVVVVLLAAAMVWLRTGGGDPAHADPDPPPSLTEADRSAVLRLLSDISLDRDALVALNPSTSQAESILNTVSGWNTTNATTLASLRNTIAERETGVRQYELSIAMGPANPTNDTALASARQDLATAKVAYQSALAPLKTSITSLLTTAQQANWTAIQTGHGQSMPIRMLALTDGQRLSLSDAQRRYEYRRASAGSQTDRDAAQADYEASLQQILGVEHQSVLTGYQTNYASASAAVASAWSTVLGA